MALSGSVLEGNFYFKTDANGIIDKSRVICHHCQKDFAYHKSSSSLKYHLKAKHPAFYTGIVESPVPIKPEAPLGLGEGAPKWWLQQPPSTNFPSYSDVRYEPDGIITCFAEWFSKDCRPLSLCEDAGLQDVFRVASSNPNFQLPTKESVWSKIEDLYGEMKQTVFQQLGEAAHVSLTLDHWLSLEGVHYLSMTGHFISGWRFRSVVLAIESSHEEFSPDVISNRITLACSQWGILGKLSVIGAFGGPMVQAVRSMNKTAMSCTALALRSAMDRAIRECGIEDLLVRVRKLVNYLSQPAVKMELEMERGQGAGLDNLVQDIPNNWGSVVAMLESFLSCKDEVLLVLSRQLYDTDIPPLVDPDWEKLAKVVGMLSPCVRAAALLGGSRFLPCSIVFPLVAHLVAASKVADTDPAYVVRFKDGFARELRALQATLMQKDFLKLATVLDPRFKSLRCFKKEERDGVWELVRRELHAQHESANPPPAKKSKSVLVFGDSSSDDEGAAGDPGFFNGTLSVSLYKVEAPIGDDECPLKWWGELRIKYPLLSRLALRVLSVPATLVPSNSLFSPAGDTMARKVSALNPENLGKLVCLSSWLNK